MPGICPDAASPDRADRPATEKTKERVCVPFCVGVVRNLRNIAYFGEIRHTESTIPDCFADRNRTVQQTAYESYGAGFGQVRRRPVCGSMFVLDGMLQLA